MSKQEKQFYDFDGFRLDVKQKLLLRDGQPVPLTPKAFDTLLMLVEHSGRVLEKDELMKHVWPDTFVEEANLANNISLLRKALSEESGNSQYIQTIPKRGYRFVAAVREISAQDAELVLEKHTLSRVVVEEEQAAFAAQSRSARLLAPATPASRFLTVLRYGWLMLLLVLVVGLTAGILISRRMWPPTAPAFHQITFRRGVVWSAKYAPDAETIVYGAAWEGGPSELFSARSGSTESRSLQLSDATVLSISSNGEMALMLKPRFMGTPILGMLARLPLSGGEAPREVLGDVQDADWSPDGKDLAVVHWDGPVCRLEYPLKTTLYEARNPEWLSDVRISPKGDLIAFLDHPAERFDDRGSVVVIDRAGKKVLQSSSFTSAFGLAWSPVGDEVWFTASPNDLNNSLYAVSLSGKLRVVARAAGRLRLHDIARDGRVLVTRDNIRTGIVALAPGETKERDLSWFDGSWLRDMSDDGRTLLFDEEGEAGGATAAVYLRKTDGSPAVRLGEGHAIALAPDGKSVLARQRFTLPPRMILLPAGAGDQRNLTAGQIEFEERGYWFSDSKRILLMGNEPGQTPRCFVYDQTTGQTQAIASEGTNCRLVSPDGKWMIVERGESRVLYPVGEGELRPIPGLQKEDNLLRWSADGRSLYLAQTQDLLTRLYQFDPATGKRELLRAIAPSDPAGLLLITSIRLSGDGKSYAYTYFRVFADLYAVDSLK